MRSGRRWSQSADVLIAPSAGLPAPSAAPDYGRWLDRAMAARRDVLEASCRRPSIGSAPDLDAAVRALADSDPRASSSYPRSSPARISYSPPCAERSATPARSESTLVSTRRPRRSWTASSTPSSSGAPFTGPSNAVCRSSGGTQPRRRAAGRRVVLRGELSRAVRGRTTSKVPPSVGEVTRGAVHYQQLRAHQGRAWIAEPVAPTGVAWLHLTSRPIRSIQEEVRV